MNKQEEKVMHKVIDDIIDKYDQEQMRKLVDELLDGGKPFYLSKTLWVNVIALVAIIVQGYYGFVISPEIQGLALVIINIVLRKLTKEELV